MPAISVTFALLAGLSVLTAAQPATDSPASEQILSLNGAWRLEPAGGTEREVTVPGLKAFTFI